MGGFGLLQGLEKRTAAAVVFDPQYRGLLDAMGYGNEGEGRERKRAGLPQMTDALIGDFIEQIQRVLRPSGHLFLWVDKFTIGAGRHLRYLQRAPLLQVVELIHWNKMRPGMGRRARCRSEYLVVCQKLPLRAGGVWTDHRIDDSWAEASDRSVHPHAKPHQLTERLIRATTKIGDLVVDPCAGGYGVLEACRLSRREFLGCDLVSS